MSLLSLPTDILVLLPDFLHNIEDYINLSSACRALRSCLNSPSPATVLRLAAAQTKIFFRPSPHFLVAATARELGDWARQSEANEAELAHRLQDGIDALLNLALEKGCGLTLERTRELHQMRFDIINPVTNIIDQCVGQQWCDVPDFWNGGRSDAYTISSEPAETFFHLAIYGELFGRDFEAFLNPQGQVKRLKVDTRLEFIKYCVPDFATECGNGRSSTVDPRRAVKRTGPYRLDPTETDRRYAYLEFQHNIALTWVNNSSRWRPHWERFREAVGCTDFLDSLDDGWWYDEESDHPEAWRQRLLMNVMICQGLEGLEMVSPAVSEAARVAKWKPKVLEWRRMIESMERDPGVVIVERQATAEWPYLLGDLRVCASGYVGGT